MSVKMLNTQKKQTPKILRASSLQKQLPGDVCVKNMFLEISQNSQENTCTRISFFNKVAG